jgi:ferric-dicitrate binding protein FerR (iron transport regulator)
VIRGISVSTTRFRLPVALAILAASLVAQNAPQVVPLTDGAARAISLAGQVSVMRDNAPWALNQNDFIKPQQIIVTGSDGYAVFKVADGSTFDVYPNSRVVFRANASDWKDLVDVYLGKIKVKIEHFGSVPNHNTVRTPTAVIAVRGTIFDVNVEDEDSTTLVLCEEGRVEVSHTLQPGKSRMLEQGEWVRLFKNQPLARQNVDRGMVMQRAMRAASDALNEILLRRAGNGTGTGATGTSTGGASGDKPGAPTPTGGGTGPPPPPPPPHD